MVAALLSWAEEFDAGVVNDPALVDGTLDPAEKVAVRVGPVVYAILAIAPEPTVRSSDATGILLATDRRLRLLVDRAVSKQWTWSEDIDMLTPLRDGLGVMWSPSEAWTAAGGPHPEGLVVPELVKGKRLKPEQMRAVFPEFMKVQAAWRASQPGGLAAWVAEFRQRYDR